MDIQTRTPQASNFFSVRERCIGLLRIAFGVAWAVAACLKWQPAFINGFAATIKSAIDGQPHIVQVWLGFWLTMITVNPTLFAIVEASLETLLAVCFLLGVFTNVACIVGMILALGIWSIPEAFGGPYIAGQSTDIGTAFPYAILCALFLCANAGRYYGIDHLLAARLKRSSTNKEAHETKVEEKVPSFVGERRIHHR
ncbi:MAG: DoxX family protein [Ktedonobacteraceae bacterium]|nr:DoxX family protein [Ktedonobacteraceae bacterium]